MAELIRSGAWVEIQSIVLAPHQRAPHIPQDTKLLPLEMRVKGFLSADAALGDQVEIVTVTGRHLRGTLAAVNPAYTHGFGAPVAELLAVGGEVRALLRAAAEVK